MRGGALDRRVTIERATITQDDYNEDIEIWAPLVTVLPRSCSKAGGSSWRRLR